MAFTPQDDAGSITGANAYISAAEFKAYHDDRQGDYAGNEDTDIEAAIVRATSYVDTRFSDRFIGSQLSLEQGTSWPRTSAYDRSGFDLSYSIPQILKDAVAEYAFRALGATDLAPDPETDASGRLVTKELVRVEGAITEEKQYAETSRPSTFQPYPIADAMIKRLLKGGSSMAVRN